MCDMTPKAASSAIGDTVHHAASYDARNHAITLAVRRATRRRIRPGLLMIAGGLGLVALAIAVAFSSAATALPVITFVIVTGATITGFALALIGVHETIL